MAKTEKAPTEKTKGKILHKLLGPFLLILAIAMIPLLKQGFTFFLLGMLPAFVAYVSDISAQKYRFQVVFACNLCGMLPYIIPVFRAADKSIVQSFSGNPTTWLIVYGWASIGWALLWIGPRVAGMYLSMKGAAESVRQSSLQEKLVKEWGPEVRREWN